MAEPISLKLDELAMGPLRLAKTTNEEYIPGIRKQGEGKTARWKRRLTPS